jgi:hypothetical protein
MLESWNDGFKKTSIQNAYNFIEFLVLMAFFNGKNQKKDSWRASSKNLKFNISGSISRFPFFMPIFQHSIIPSFHAAQEENDCKKMM